MDQRTERCSKSLLGSWLFPMHIWFVLNLAWPGWLEATGGEEVFSLLVILWSVLQNERMAISVETKEYFSSFVLIYSCLERGELWPEQSVVVSDVRLIQRASTYKCFAKETIKKGKRNFSESCSSTRTLLSKCHRFIVLVCILSIVYR